MEKVITRMKELDDLLFTEMKYKRERNNLYYYHYVIDESSNITEQDLKTILNLNKAFSLFSTFCYKKDFVLSSTNGFESRINKMFKGHPRYAICSNFEKYKNEIPNILNKYDNLIIEFKNNIINNNNTLNIYDMIYENYKEDCKNPMRRYFKQKLIMFPINNKLYYFSKKVINEGDILWRNINGKMYRDVDGLIFSGG